MDDVFERFKEHKLLINVTGATEKDMELLGEMLDLTWRSGARLHKDHLPVPGEKMYLHCEEGSITYGNSLDYHPEKDVIGYKVFMTLCNYTKIKDIQADEIERLFGE